MYLYMLQNLAHSHLKISNLPTFPKVATITRAPPYRGYRGPTYPGEHTGNSVPAHFG